MHAGSGGHHQNRMVRNDRMRDNTLNRDQAV